MKMHLFLRAVVFTGLVSTVTAEVKIPKSVHREAESLEAAKAEAQAKKRPITIIWSMENSGCPFCDGATAKAVQEFRNKTVMVFFKSGPGTREKMPASVQKVMTSPESGKSIPKVAIFDANLENAIAVIPFTKDDKAYADSCRDAERKIRAAKSAAGS